MEREQARCEARAAAEEAAAAELTFVRLCEFCGRSKFKNIMSYSQHKRFCFDVLCKGLAASAADGGALKVRLRVNGEQHELDGATARGRRRAGAEGAEGGGAAGHDAPRLVRAVLLVSRPRCPSAHRAGLRGGGEGAVVKPVTLELSVLLKPRQRKVLAPRPGPQPDPEFDPEFGPGPLPLPLPLPEPKP